MIWIPAAIVASVNTLGIHMFVAVMFWQWLRPENGSVSPDSTRPCPNCGRANSKYTRVCPRCETHLNSSGT